ncbi:DNA gyrase inhibitor YacG [Porticoccaceae bacterium LTM1]|nr:DNA gyrase inhibitor YacG [Porticoccaceae bacterium LTM1]
MSELKKKPLELSCPTCKKTIEWSDQFPHRPFCSARCKQIDFGDWANETNSIPGEPVLDPELLEEAESIRH